MAVGLAMSDARAQVLDEVTVYDEGIVVLRGHALAAVARIVRQRISDLDASEVPAALHTLALELDAGAQRALRASQLGTSARGNAETPFTSVVPSSPHEPNRSPHLNSAEAAQRTGLTERRIRQLCRAGEFDGARQVDARGTWSIPEGEVTEYAREQQRERHG